jgi:hypothetical protein
LVRISPPAGLTGNYAITLTVTNLYTGLFTTYDFDLAVY